MRLVKEFQRCDRGSAGKRVAGVGVAVVEGLSFFQVAGEGLLDFVAADGGGQRQVSAGDPLGQAEDVGGHLLAFTGKKFAGTTKARGDFVSNKQNVVLITQLAHGL